MNKINGTGLNEVAISLAALKQSSVGDEVVVQTTDGQVGWFAVDGSTAVRGCKGGTTMVLRDLVSGDLSTHLLRSELPEGVARIRRVSAGVNVRTTRLITPAVATPAPVIAQPVGEFENILDVPDEAPAALETVAEAVDAELASQTAPEPLETVADEAPASDESAVG